MIHSSIDDATDEAASVLLDRGVAVLVAPPGTGKTTVAPPRLLTAGVTRGQRIVMLEPRRIAARAAAQRMAHLLGEPVGQTVGYRTRGDVAVSTATRIEVITERLLVRMIQQDPMLDDVGLVIFDEIHERSLDTDLGLALALDIRGALRDDLAILAMSATPDIEAVAAVLADDDGDAAVIEVSSVAHPIDTRHVGRDHRRPLADEVADAVRDAVLDHADGDVLVFLPGRAEIRAAESALARGRALPSTVDVVTLTGGGSTDALIPARPGRRKVILSTSVAQTSLTIDGVRIVVDSGLERSAEFDPDRGTTELITRGVSIAAADQRRGRAGRQAPGTAYRLWSPPDDRHRRGQSVPEVESADLSGLALDLAHWGVSDPTSMRWLSRPPERAWRRAIATLASAELIERTGNSHTITGLGHRVVELGAEPLLGALMIRAADMGQASVGAALAAVVQDGSRGDLAQLIGALDAEQRSTAGRWTRRLDPSGTSSPRKRPAGEDLDTVLGDLVTTTFPERVARRREQLDDSGNPRYLLASGMGAVLAPRSGIAPAEWLAVAQLGGASSSRDHTIVSAVPLTPAALRAVLDTATRDRAELTERSPGELSAKLISCVGAIDLHERPGAATTEQVLDAAVGVVQRRGVDLLSWSNSARRLQARALFARTIDPRLADVSHEALADSAADWLGSHLRVRGSTVSLGSVEGGAVLRSLLDWQAVQTIDRLAPERIVLPSGRSATIDYTADGPVLAVKLQELLGSSDTPRIADGAVPLMLHLLSPAGRPLQITSDLAGFWAGSYAAVRAEMRGRYPKHAWPEHPATHQR